MADPFILFHENKYYAYGTYAGDGIAVFVSDDLKNWTPAGISLPKFVGSMRGMRIDLSVKVRYRQRHVRWCEGRAAQIIAASCSIHFQIWILIFGRQASIYRRQKFFNVSSGTLLLEKISIRRSNI